MPRDNALRLLDDQPNSTRRNFIKNGGMILAGSAIVGSNASVAKSAHAFGSDTIKLGLVGCGRRGIKATIEALNTSQRAGSTNNRFDENTGRIELVAIADAFKNNLHTAYRTLKGKHSHCVASNLARFDGLGAFQGVAQSDADVVILAAPPAFRPLHFHAAVAAGKHVFMEKPVAADVDGVRQVLATGIIASEKGLAVSVGLQRRHEPRYQQTIEQLQSGIIGQPALASTTYNVNHWKMRPRRKKESEQEYQLRNWMAFDHLGGDSFVEQHVQNLDVINWLLNACPVQAKGLEGITAGDHQSVEFTYHGGIKLLSQYRQHQSGNRVGEQVQCTGGSADISGAKILDLQGNLVWRSDSAATKGNGWQALQDNFFASLRRGERPNETEVAARSTMTALLGRMATRSPRPVSWDEAILCQDRVVDVSSLTL